ncbi:hypothetical protein MJD09_22475 [bacterium]|nr:hypothetical protein [bacterium]
MPIIIAKAHSGPEFVQFSSVLNRKPSASRLAHDRQLNDHSLAKAIGLFEKRLSHFGALRNDKKE